MDAMTREAILTLTGSSVALGALIYGVALAGRPLAPSPGQEARPAAEAELLGGPALALLQPAHDGASR